jgi:hypothetical protein
MLSMVESLVDSCERRPGSTRGIGGGIAYLHAGKHTGVGLLFGALSLGRGYVVYSTEVDGRSAEDTN